MSTLADDVHPLALSATATVGRLQRVLYVLTMDPTEKFGSLEEQLLQLALGFRERSSQFLPLFSCRTAAEGAIAFRTAGVPIECLDLQRFRWQTLRRLLRIIVQNQMEIVHWNFCPPLTNAYLWALSLLAPRLQHYFTDHNSRDLPITPPRRGWLRAGKRLLLKRYRRVLGVSDFIVNCLQEQHSWPRPECCLHFINTDRFRPDRGARLRLREQWDVGDDFVVLTVAHLIPAKGVEVLLRALAVLPKKIVLWVAGSGPEQERLRALGHDLGAADRVRWLGLQGHVEPYMQAADAFICPSLWAEAAGLVNIEAQACGLPVIASNLGGIPEHVAAERTGLLFPAGDHRQLAACVERLFASPALCQEMGRQARAWALQRFSIAARMEDVIALYRDSVGPA